MQNVADRESNILQRLKRGTRSVRRDVFTLFLAIRHPQAPWYAKVVAATVVVYALSPFDLIPDPIPVLGYLDDLIVVPLGVLAVRWMIPAGILAECRQKATDGVRVGLAWKWAGGIAISALWFLCIMWMASWWRKFRCV